MSNRGFPVPPSLEEGFECAVVFYPKDDGRFFSRALLGHLLSMQYPWTWEAEHEYGKDVGRKWIEANQLTLDAFGKLDCELVPFILGDETMDININLSGSCGCSSPCGCGSGGVGSGDIFNPTLPDGDYPTPPLPSTDGGDDSIHPYQCDAAHEFYSQFREFVNEVQTIALTGQASLSAIIAAAGVLAILTGGLTVLLTIIVGLGLGTASYVWEWLDEWLDYHKDELICIMATATSPAGARNAMLAFLEDNKSTPLGNTAGYFIKNLFGGILQDVDWNKLFQDGSMPIRSGNVGSDCSDCDGYVPFDPDTPSVPVEIELAPGYWLIPMHALASDTAVNGGTIAYLGDGVFQIDGDAFGGRDFQPDLSVHGWDMTKDAGTRTWGWQIEVISLTQQASSPFASTYFHANMADVPTGLHRGWAHNDLDSWGAGAGQWDCRNQETDTPMNSGNTAYGGSFINALGSGHLTMQFKLWIVMETAGEI